MNRPATLVCHICGREFGTKSLPIHVKACEKKWENEENLKPPKERRPCPQAPKGFNELVSKDKITRQDIDKFNSKSYDAFVEEALVECEYCGRRFNPKSLVPHQKACKTHPMLKKPYVSKAQQAEKEEEQPISRKPFAVKEQPEYSYDAGPSTANLVPCRRCGRTFLPDRVGKHERVCKADKVEAQKPEKKEIPVEKPASKLKPNFGVEKKPKWKQQHEEFQNALKVIKQMKAVEARGGKLSDLPPPPRGNYDHYVECKYCGRKYAADVAERHIPKCANIINKPGGIKPSRIQEKYVAGTGANKSYSGAANPFDKPPPIKPNIVTTTKLGPSNTPKPPSQPAKPTASSEITSSNMKPNFKSRNNANKYW